VTALLPGHVLAPEVQHDVVLGHDVAPGLEIVDVELPDPAELHTSGCVVWTSDNPCDCGSVDR
jgi:hypothetical protein